jgi:hypothetical protein
LPHSIIVTPEGVEGAVPLPDGGAPGLATEAVNGAAGEEAKPARRKPVKRRKRKGK